MAAEPTQVTQTQVGFAPELAPYGQRLLGRAESLFDEGYQQYQPERVAQFSPLQQMSYENAGLMQPQGQLQDATALAGQAGLGALNTSYTYNPYQTKAFNSPGMAESYMSPYMKNVVERQQQDATRQAGIASQAQGAQAARAGAFGGSGDYLMRGQARGNLNRQLGDIYAQGQQAAYQQGMGQFNAEQAATQNAAQLNAQQGQFGAGLGLQGLQTSLTAANALGNLGGAQYQQGMGINALQNQYGLQQQAQMQKDLDTRYQDFLGYQNYPYKQLGFMSDLIRGSQLTGGSSSNIYQAPPTAANQAIGLGLGAAGIGSLVRGLSNKEGGVIKGYKKGGLVMGEGLAELGLYKVMGGEV